MTSFVGFFITIFFHISLSKTYFCFFITTARKSQESRIFFQSFIISPKVYQEWFRAEVESRTQGSRPRPRPRTQKKSEAKAKAKDSLSEDRHSRGQGQECSRPRPRTKDTKRKCSPKKKKKKRSSQKFFKRSPLKNVFQKIFQPLHKILTFQKIVLSSSRGQANFRGLEASRPRPRPRTSKSVLEDVLEAKDVLEDSTSGFGCSGTSLGRFYTEK